ncbi:unnamed protein product [Taenia asiatica]|uniref:Uncharacterized protein n=1 Tax=Taenia asiatica TaxID=60517 RepID=A0A0R3W7Q9_TAEAS|nr:unnamed protein product [Taenia asiatica]
MNAEDVDDAEKEEQQQQWRERREQYLPAYLPPTGMEYGGGANSLMFCMICPVLCNLQPVGAWYVERIQGLNSFHHSLLPDVSGVDYL